MSDEIKQWDNVCDKCGQPQLTKKEETLSLIVFFDDVRARDEFAEALKGLMSKPAVYEY